MTENTTPTPAAKQGMPGTTKALLVGLALIVVGIILIAAHSVGFGILLLVVGVFCTAPASAKRDAVAAKRPEMVCPHCQERGGVSVSRPVKRKAGISGGKATGAILTGGVSVLATGLSRKTKVRNCSCTNCRMKWVVEA